MSKAANNSWIQQSYKAMRLFARCQWSPLAVPLPFASTYKQREILGCKRRRQVCHARRGVHSVRVREVSQNRKRLGVARKTISHGAVYTRPQRA